MTGQSVIQDARDSVNAALRAEWALMTPDQYRLEMYRHPRTTARHWQMFIPCVQSGVAQSVIDDAAEIAAQAERDGKPVGAWHAVSVAAGFAIPERCCCTPCRKAKGTL